MRQGARHARRSHTEILLSNLADERSRRVAFLSHCLLNQNVRYLGGAFRPGVVDEVVDPLRRDGVGIYQMPCPEQRAWGGVLKRYTLPFYGSGGGLGPRLRRVLLPLFIWHTRRVYRRIAREVTSDIEDYVRSGFEVTGVVGIAGSPSCGVCRTVNLSRALGVISSCPVGRLDRSVVNRQAIAGAVQEGAGVFIQELQRQLRRRGIEIPMREHDSLAATASHLGPGVP
jgi:uncharacterized protein YbbK (DUF523 family)